MGLVLNLQAQNTPPVQDNGPKVIYTRQHSEGFTLASNGFGAFACYGKYRNAYSIRLYQLDIQFLKHEKEKKYYFPNQNAKGYFYGKQNNFYNIRLGFGNKKIIAEKLRPNGVQVSWSWLLGPDIGLLKPIYLEIIYSYPGSDTYYLQVEKYDPTKHFADNNIYGRASGFRGLNEMKIVPGGFSKVSFNFEFSNYRDGLKGIETGVCVDAFPYRVPIMAEKILKNGSNNARNHQFFVSVFLQIFFGKKYNKL